MSYFDSKIPFKIHVLLRKQIIIDAPPKKNMAHYEKILHLIFVQVSGNTAHVVQCIFRLH